MTARKREQLLDTAERLFYAEGFHATGIDRIVTEAGVVRMTLYNHFPSKEALVAEVLDRRHKRFLARLDAALADSAPGAAVRALAEAHGPWLASESRQGCILVKAMGEFAEHGPAIHARAHAAKQDLLERIRAALAKDGLAAREGLDRRLFLVLEGSNNAVPVLGVEAALAATRQSLDDLLITATAGSA